MDRNNRIDGSKRMRSHESMTSSRRMIMEQANRVPLNVSIEKPNYQDMPAGARSHIAQSKPTGKAIIRPVHQDNKIF